MSDQSPRKPYKPGNIAEDGSYMVGKNRPPESGQFKAGDGRERGRRPKGQRNFDTEFEAEARRLMTIRENGQERRVSKMRASIIRAFDNSNSKGEPRSLGLVFTHSQRISDKRAPSRRSLPSEDDALIDAWLRDRSQTLANSAPQDPHGGNETSDQYDSKDGGRA